MAIELHEKVKSASRANLKNLTPANQPLTPPPTALTKTTNKIIAIGASTGGTQALEHVLRGFPSNSPGTVIVQHMPAGFTKSFAARLNELCQLEVKEAENGDTVVPGKVLLAPGNFHMLLKRSGANYYVEVKEGPLVNRHRPSVEILFNSTAKVAGPNAVGIMLTGMGADGATGMRSMRDAGARTICQNEASCVVFGMPKAAIEAGAAEFIEPLSKIAAKTLELSSKD